jgi:hypothetical protein
MSDLSWPPILIVLTGFFLYAGCNALVFFREVFTFRRLFGSILIVDGIRLIRFG